MNGIGAIGMFLLILSADFLMEKLTPIPFCMVFGALLLVCGFLITYERKK